MLIPLGRRWLNQVVWNGWRNRAERVSGHLWYDKPVAFGKSLHDQDKPVHQTLLAWILSAWGGNLRPYILSLRAVRFVARCGSHGVVRNPLAGKPVWWIDSTKEHQDKNQGCTQQLALKIFASFFSVTDAEMGYMGSYFPVPHWTPRTLYRWEACRGSMPLAFRHGRIYLYMSSAFPLPVQHPFTEKKEQHLQGRRRLLVGLSGSSHRRRREHQKPGRLWPSL